MVFDIKGRIPTCEYLHPKDDSRYKNSTIDNRFLYRQVETLVMDANDMISSAKKDRYLRPN